jgi:hypothetical protein
VHCCRLYFTKQLVKRGAHWPLAILYDVGVRPGITRSCSLTGTTWSLGGRRGLVTVDGDESEAGIDVIVPGQAQHACEAQLGREGRHRDGDADVVAGLPPTTTIFVVDIRFISLYLRRK